MGTNIVICADQKKKLSRLLEKWGSVNVSKHVIEIQFSSLGFNLISELHIQNGS